MGIAERGTNAEVTVVRGRCCFCSKRLSKNHTEQKCWLNLANQAICYSTDDEEEAIAENSYSVWVDSYSLREAAEDAAVQQPKQS